MKNRFVVLAMVGVMALSMVACGSASTNTETESAQVEDEAVPTASNEAAQDLDENSIDFIKQVSNECAPEIDFSDCDTFTDMLNKKKITAGMGYANITVGDVDVFAVTSGTYDNMDGNMAGIDATLFTYDDGNIVELGKICSGGTAYPIATKDGYIYTASNHWVCKYVIGDDNSLQIMEKASVVYDTDGNGTYFYESEDGGDYSKIDSAHAEEIMNQLYDEMGAAEVINFDTVAE
ncbi:hypothetical protein [Pseudobutyrivibrio xylanivorans]|uniref:Uncharacterized protein n=1 Tax=Pseudobutyrivibrio xylanivorans DSM 14809 TaxID=1123012 RepID=A0A1M6IDN6_PSEXY|nr:hypothetical protein [Pseudobutyrivibrio xylanivorans]SHJ32436.1 hypothetical protein SAMN02745725_02273 [Pseudobutyrivibrio xylanivorans DSM 14809]